MFQSINAAIAHNFLYKINSIILQKFLFTKLTEFVFTWTEFSKVWCTEMIFLKGSSWFLGHSLHHGKQTSALCKSETISTKWDKIQSCVQNNSWNTQTTPRLLKFNFVDNLSMPSPPQYVRFKNAGGRGWCTVFYKM